MYRPPVITRSGLVIFLYFISFSGFAQATDSSFTVDSIVVEGNRKTKTSIILRELSFRVGDSIQNWSYHQEQSRKQLINLFLFNEIELSRSGGMVHIKVTERWYIWPIPELDYADRNFNQWWLTKDPKRLIYGVNLEWYNIRGRNETMVLSLITGYTKMASINYKIPYFNKKQTWGLQLSAQYNSNKELWYKTAENKVQFFRDNDKDIIYRKNAELIFVHRKKIFSYHQFYTGYRQSEIADTILTSSVNRSYHMFNLKEQKEQYIGYLFINDRRDFKGFPLLGHLFKLNGEFSNYPFGKPALVGEHSMQTLLIKAYLSKYFKIKGQFYGSVNLTARYYKNPDLQYSRAQALGYGKDYIRGYELNVIDGQHFALAKSEVKYRFLNRKFKFFPKVKNYEVLPLALFLSTYFDIGYVAKENHGNLLYDNNTLPNTIQHGGGMGLNIVMFYDYCARIEYSFDKYLNNRVYLSFVAAM